MQKNTAQKLFTVQKAASNTTLLFTNGMAHRNFGVVQDVPTMGDSITEGVVESYVKNVGEYVAADEVVARIETDKVTVDILS